MAGEVKAEKEQWGAVHTSSAPASDWIGSRGSDLDRQEVAGFKQKARCEATVAYPGAALQRS